MDPVNTQAATFLSRRKIVNTIQEALDTFATKASGSDAVRSIEEIIQRSLASEEAAFVVTIKVARDLKNPGRYFVSLESKIEQRIGHEAYSNVRRS